MKKTISSSNKTKHNLSIEIITALLLIFFVHSCISTYIQLQSLRNLLNFYTIYTKASAWTIVIWEAVTVLLLFIHKTRLVGFLSTITFSITAIWVIIHWPHYPHDFGGIFNSITRSQKWALLLFLILLPTLGILLIIFKSKHKSQSNSDHNIVFT